ncbi:hypothetical protein, partial [Thiolapillus sp.]|uniref:hypothetical protein n=1 Tax=Thiolapillus sp. TaxID=2017437 RepID=UPI003AF48BE7
RIDPHKKRHHFAFSCRCASSFITHLHISKKVHHMSLKANSFQESLNHSQGISHILLHEVDIE